MKYGNNSQSILFFNPKSVPVRLSLTKKYRTDKTIIRFIWAEVVERVIVCHKHAFVAVMVSKGRTPAGIHPAITQNGFEYRISEGWSNHDRTMIEHLHNIGARPLPTCRDRLLITIHDERILNTNIKRGNKRGIVTTGIFHFLRFDNPDNTGNLPNFSFPFFCAGRRIK